MSIGENTFIHSVLNHLGMESVTTNLNGNYPVISEDWIKNTAIELILFSSEPFPFKETHLIDFKVKFPHLKTLLVNGEMCSWYGSRMLLTPDYFMNFKTMNKLH